LQPKDKTMTNPPLTPEERLSRLEGVYEHLATKADITRLEGEIKAEGTRLKTDITRLEGEVKAAMAELKTELHKGLNRNLYITIGAVVAVAALVKYLP
ncbi:MAG: hypothetical protein OXM01_18695, partial [Gemmatimonadota bacterium]|nr:hypothetical protein [Gemmatimonadota bacterium]